MVRAEVRRVVTDPLFLKAPVQSKLLSYLASRTIGGGHSPNQFTVAVDGLGKSESYDLSSDSYPRVQISRLRKNLMSYYSRQQGGDGLCLYLRRGDYQLRLASFEKAYPELAASRSRPQTVAAPEADNPQTFPVAPSNALGSAPRAGASPPHWRVPFITGALAALVIVLILILVYGSKPAAHEEPTLSINVDAADSASKAMSASIGRSVGREMANSMVSEFSPTLSDKDKYVMQISIGEGGRSAIATLYDRNQHSLYAESYTGAESQDDLIDHLRSEVVFLTSRDGPIARAERQSIGDKPTSAYECYLRTIDPEYEADVLNQTGLCLARFPNSPYRARWLGMQAYKMYQNQIAAGQPVQKSGPAWAALEASLDADPRESFANFVAAKVELAADNCELAERFVQRALDPGISYPALLVAATANASGCTPPAAFKPRAKLLRALIRRTPTIDPFFQVNLMLSSIAVGNAEDAKTAAQAIVIGKSSGQARRAASLISAALLQPGAFAAHRADLQRAISQFIWSPTGRITVMQKLGEAAPR
jgi:hypothetical protein